MSVIRLRDKEFSLLLPAEKIQDKVQFIAEKMNTDLKDEDVIFLGILNGAFMFASDLLRKISFEFRVSFVKLTSYAGLKPNGNIKMLIGINEDLKDKTVVIIEDIIDTGETIKSIVTQIKGYLPRQVYVATLLLKPEKVKTDIIPDYVGFKIPSDFVVGYGLDYIGYGRNLGSIYKLINHNSNEN